VQEDPDFKPIPPEFRAKMNELAHFLDEYFNPGLPGLGRGERHARGAEITFPGAEVYDEEVLR
jgi:hypothetical protein